MTSAQPRVRRFSPQVILNFADLDKNTQDHLKNVYVTLSIGLLTCGVVAHAYTVLSGLRAMGMLLSLVSVVLSLGSLGFLAFTPHSQETVGKRLLAFLALSGSSGLGLGPLVHYTYAVNPQVLPTAVYGTAFIFVSFSLAALFARKRSMLFLGGMLMSALSTMCLLGLLNIFFRSSALFNVQLYAGLLVFCGFVLYDTQLVCEKRRLGDTDFVWHAVDLFLDFVEIFRHLLIILNRKNERRNREE